MIFYLFLFISSFLAATVLPFSSEVILFALVRQGEPEGLLILTASLGNTLGAAVNWYLGRFLLHYQDRNWFYFKQDQIEKMQHWFQRYGIWSLLFSWLPLGGDVLTFIAGVMKVNFLLFIILVGVGKTLRYIAVFYLAAWPILSLN
ncbi:YqaA family protein [Desulfopila inferna]|uniref:YqaA family protein n=1 Tax=Desulfopila inferna TaxID=468528 RepID=UPI001963E8A6|nr:YqaA family protein [Desulfopila inferna]MBM9605181.1 DedA family protein [Desulfopila inferna]